MKELRIEDKAKRYDEAIERAKSVIEQNPLMEYLRKGIEYIFPELAESDDERIRKSLIELVQGIYMSCCTEEAGKERDMFLAWLEKQGEQKPIDKVGVWSEEDENHVKSILSTIECCKAQFPNAQAVVEAYNADIEWLKSLRPQSRWKPSDEQMEALDNFIYAKYPNIEKYGAAVKLLYQDLKKLREE